MSLELGIVGLPNVGKSTLFQAITASPAESANYPFCTIEPNIGIVQVPDERMDVLVNLVQPAKVIHNIIKIIDIAGLVKGASKGEGLGNQFLSHIRQVDAIAHLVRCFHDDNVVHVEGKTDPISDIEIIKTELILADLEQVGKKIEKTKKASKKDQEFAKRLPFYETLYKLLDTGKSASSLELTEDEEIWIKELNLITKKPFFYIMNVAEDELNQITSSQKEVQKIAKEEDVNCIKISCKFEAELSEMEPEERKEFLLDSGILSTGLDQVIQEGFRLLNQITYFTVGPKEVRAWNIEKNTLAPQAAGKIHSDMERGFICAEVYHYDAMKEYESEIAVKEAGKFRTEGKNYLVQDGDIMHFRFNV